MPGSAVGARQRYSNPVVPQALGGATDTCEHRGFPATNPMTRRGWGILIDLNDKGVGKEDNR